MALVAKNTDDYIDQMIILTDRLYEITLKQIKSLEANEFDEFSPEGDDISRLAAVYYSESKKISNNPFMINDGTDALKAALKDSTKRFRDIMGKHERLLERNAKITEGLVKTIAAETVKTRPAPISYGASGARMSPTRNQSSAIALNRLA